LDLTSPQIAWNYWNQPLDGEAAVFHPDHHLPIDLVDKNARYF